MTEVTAEQFARRAYELNLIDEQQLDAVWGGFRSRDVPIDDFKNSLLRREMLTNYQIERLLSKERSGFFYGDYKVLYRVGTGTFARVFRSVHRKTGKVVAVKVLRNRFSEDAEKTEQFLREGEMGKQFRHPNIVPIYEVHSSGKTHYLVMQFVEGRNMRDFVKVRGHIEAVEAIRFGTDIVAGLAHAYEIGVTHRDMKLSNILISSQGRAKLVDFGLAAMTVSPAAASATLNPRSIDYAGLEKLTGVRRDDPRSDIFFVGCVLYQMLCGKSALLETKDKAKRASPERFRNVVPLTKRMPSVPMPAALVVSKAMELNADKRYQEPAAMLQDLKLTTVRLEELAASGKAADKVEKSTSKPANAPLTAASFEGASRTVMVIESNTDMQDVFRDRLKKHGYRVLVIGNPKLAISRLADVHCHVDLLLVSTIGLGRTALEMFNQIDELTQEKNVPGILLLAEGHGVLEKEAKLASHRVVVSMPLKMAALRALLLKLLQAPVQ